MQIPLRQSDEDDPIIEEVHPILYKNNDDTDIMCVYQVLRESNIDQFIEAIQKEVQYHLDWENVEVVHKLNFPNKTAVLSYVWAMKHKQQIAMHKVYKWKSLLNIHGIKQQYGLNYWENYAPLVTWTDIKLILILFIMTGWHTKKIDFLLDYPQAPVKYELFMKIPKIFDVERNPSSHSLQIFSNLYRGK